MVNNDFESQFEKNEILDSFRPPYPFLEIIRSTTDRAYVMIDYKQLFPYLQTYKKEVTTEEVYLSILNNTYKFMSYDNEYDKIYHEIDSLTDIFLDFLLIFVQDENFEFEHMAQTISPDIAKRLVSNIPMNETFERFFMSLTPVMINTMMDEKVKFKGNYTYVDKNQKPNPYRLDLSDKIPLLMSILHLFLVEVLFGIHNATARKRREFYPDSIITNFNENLRDKLKAISKEQEDEEV